MDHFPSYLDPFSSWIVPMDFPIQNLHRGILLPVSAPQVSNTALAARECLRLWRAPIPRKRYQWCWRRQCLLAQDVQILFMEYFYGDLMVN